MTNKDNYPNYSRLCPEPVKDKTELPAYWQQLNIYEQQKWVTENLIEESLYYDTE